MSVSAPPDAFEAKAMQACLHTACMVQMEVDCIKGHYAPSPFVPAHYCSARPCPPCCPQWLRYTWPDTRVALSALLPNAYIDLTSLNEEYARLAENRGALFFDCNEGLDATSASQFGDGTHWLPEGQRIWLECMREAVGPLLEGWEGQNGGSNSTEMAG